ncbi:MAG: hypothetical protein ACRD99_03785, partial [Nitrososphaera sp.]
MMGRKTRLALATALFAIFSGMLLASDNVFGALESAAAQETEAMQPITLKTDNGSVNIILRWEPQEIELAQEVSFIVDYRDALSDQPLTHVNHDFKIVDESGQVIESATGLHTHSGGDIHTVTFDQTG